MQSPFPTRRPRFPARRSQSRPLRCNRLPRHRQRAKFSVSLCEFDERDRRGASLFRQAPRNARPRAAGDRRARLLDRRIRNRRARRSTARARPRPARRSSTRCSTSRSSSTSRARSARSGGERSPFGFDLGITYPKPDVDALFAAVAQAQATWRKAGPEAWVGVCARDPRTASTRRASLIANAVMHTTGPGVHDGVPGRRPARAGPRARGGRLRVGRDAPHPGRRRTGKSRRARTSRCAWRSTSASCRAASGSSSAAARFPTWNGYPGTVRRASRPATRSS